MPENGRVVDLKRRMTAQRQVADTAAKEAAVALDYLRAAAALAGRVHPTVTEALLAQVVDDVWGAGTELLDVVLITGAPRMGDELGESA